MSQVVSIHHACFEILSTDKNKRLLFENENGARNNFVHLWAALNFFKPAGSTIETRLFSVQTYIIKEQFVSTATGVSGFDVYVLRSNRSNINYCYKRLRTGMPCDGEFTSGGPLVTWPCSALRLWQHNRAKSASYIGLRRLSVPIGNWFFQSSVFSFIQFVPACLLLNRKRLVHEKTIPVRFAHCREPEAQSDCSSSPTWMPLPWFMAPTSETCSGRRVSLTCR